MNRMGRFYRSFIGRTVLAALFMHTLLALFLAAGIYRIIAGDLKDEFVNSVRSQSRQFGMSLDSQPSAAAIRGLMQDWLLSGQLVSADLVLADGAVISGHDAARPDPSGFVEDFRFDEHATDVYSIAVPVSAATGQVRGVLQLGFDKRPVKDRIHLLYERGLYLILGYLAVGLVLAWGSGTLLSRSIRQLRDAARRIAVGHTDEAARDPDRDLRNFQPHAKPRIHAPGAFEAREGAADAGLLRRPDRDWRTARCSTSGLPPRWPSRAAQERQARRHLPRSRPLQARQRYARSCRAATSC